MAVDFFSYAIFCDDIRQEVGNKQSLIGCYGRDLVTEKLPAVFPKICARVTVSVPCDAPPSGVSVRARVGDDVIIETSIDEDEVSSAMKSFLAETCSDHGRMNLNIFLVFSPLAVQERSEMVIEVDSDWGSRQAGSLLIRVGNTSPK